MSNNSTGLYSFSCPYHPQYLPFTGVSVLLMFIGFSTLLFNYVFIKVLLKCGGHLPLNTKLLLLTCSISAFVKSFYYFLTPVYNFCLTNYGFDSMALPRNYCIVIQAPFGISSYCLAISMVFVGVERLWSTMMKNLSHFETPGTHIYVIQFLIWFLSFTTYIVAQAIDANSAVQKICYCYFPMTMSSSGGTLSTVVLMGTQISNMLIYMLVYWKNRMNLSEFTLNTARYSLSERFVMWANIKVTRMLIPASVCHAGSYILAILIPKIYRFFDINSMDAYLSLIAGIFCLMALDTLVHPISCLKCSVVLGDIAINLYPKHRRCMLFGGRKVSDAESPKPANNDGEKPAPQMNFSTIVSKQQKLSVIANKQNSLNRLPLYEFRLKPEQHRDILVQQWANDVRKENVQWAKK